MGSVLQGVRRPHRLELEHKKYISILRLEKESAERDTELLKYKAQGASVDL